MLSLSDGIKNYTEKDLIPPESDNIFLLSEEEINRRGIAHLPQTLHEAVEVFRYSKLLQEVLGEHTFTKLIEAKEKEWKEFHTTVSEWEIKHLLGE